MDKIICVGKNYLKHALELGDAVPTTPTYFLKPPSVLRAIVKSGETVALPKDQEVHHEIELVFKIRVHGAKLTLSHYTFGLDLTLRKLQADLKKNGQPWEKAKVFENSAILGAWAECASAHEVLELPFELRVNKELRQHAKALDMRWKPDFLLEDLPRWFPLRDGDLLFTGTPEGVGPLIPGDLVEVRGGDINYSFKVGAYGN